MNCDTYLSMLATLPVDELAFGDARAHATHCRDCDRVTRVVAERERNMAMAFDDLYPSVASGPIAARALAISRRRTIALFYRIGLGIAAVVTVLFLVVARRVAPAPSGRVSETFRLQCLSPDQAVEVLRPVTSPSVSVSIRGNALGVIHVGASPEEMERVRAVLDRYDTPAQSECGVKLTVPKVIQIP